MRSSRSWSPWGVRAGLVLALAAVLALPLAGCKDTQAVAAVAATGTQVADNLGAYYGTLQADVGTIGQVEVFLDSLRGIPADDGEAQRLQAIALALQQRANLADALKAAYADLETLLASDAPANASASAESLVQQVESLVTMPNGVDPSTLIGDLVGDLVGAVRAREVEKANRALGEIVSGIQQLFASEIDLYAGIVREYNDDVVLLEQELIGRDMLDLQPVLQDLAALTGLKLTGTATAASAPAEVQTALAAAAVVGTRQHQAASLGAARSLDTALRELAAAHAAIDSRRAPSLAEATAAIARAGQYLDQIEQLEQEIHAAGDPAAGNTGGTP
ncbi:MAG TPA: hypothetical protein VHQ65_14675 [Thermoanaerobaculia bacterium]|nr:hypothetical protein [Thermoanaerobaculia bacterium]